MAAAVRLLLLLLSSSLLLHPAAVEDDVALLQFKESLANTVALDPSWVKGTMPCDPKNPWTGIICSGKNVQGIRLQGLHLSGDIDVAALQELQNLRGFLIANNNFSGPIPALNKLTALKSLYIHANQFSGDIPSDFFKQMGSLKKVWLSENQFAGKIPESLSKIPNLMELRLDHNEFSGPVLVMDQPSLKELNLGYNKLEGPIPEGMERFGSKAFEANPGVCGAVVQKACDLAENSLQTPGSPSYDPSSNDSSGSGGLKWVIMGMVVALLVMTLLCKVRQKEEHFDLLRKESNLDDAVQVQIPNNGAVRRTASTNRKGDGDGHEDATGPGTESSNNRPRKGSAGGGGGGGGGGGKASVDLVVVNDERGVFGLPDLMRAAAEVLGNGTLGSAYKAQMANGVSVVVKRFRELNKLSKDSFDAEVRRLGRLKHPNLLPPLAYHYRKDEKLLVSEFVPGGSLLILLHGDRGKNNQLELSWGTRLKIIKGVARGTAFLHSEFASYEVPHGNLKSSNILISSNLEPVLTDYAMFPMLSSPQTAQTLFAYKSPEGAQYQQLSPKSDVYCMGIIILEVLTRKFPSQYNNQKGGTDLVQWVKSAIAESREVDLLDPEMVNAAGGSVEQMEELLLVAAACTESECNRRIDMKEALRRIEEIQA